MKELTKKELNETFGGNDIIEAIIENAEGVANSLINLYNNVKKSVRDWGYTAGCKQVHPCE